MESEKGCDGCYHYFDYYPDGWICKTCSRGQWVKDNYKPTQQEGEAMEKVIFKKTYYGFESIFDLDRDITECLDSDYNESAKNIPAEFGGTITVVITYKEKQSPVAGDGGGE